MRALKARGVAIIFVSHRLAEIFAISDRIVVMRDGRIRGRHVTAEVSRQEIVAEMIGEIGRRRRSVRQPRRCGESRSKCAACAFSMPRASRA